MPKEKINVGMAFYGRTIKLVDPSKNYLGAPANGPGLPGPVSIHYFSNWLKLTKNLFPYLKKYTKEPGFLSYYEMCENLGKDWVRVWNDEQKIPYVHNNTDWVSYDDLESIKIKVRLLFYLR